MLLASSRVSMRRGVATGLAVLFVAGLAQRTWERMPAWRSTRALFERDVARNPEYREGRYHLAVIAYQAGDWRTAEELVTPLVRPEEASAATAGFLDEGSAATLFCMTQLARGLPTEALVFTDDLARRRPSLADRPGARFCRARGRPRRISTRWRSRPWSSSRRLPPRRTCASRSCRSSRGGCPPAVAPAAGTPRRCRRRPISASGFARRAIWTGFFSNSVMLRHPGLYARLRGGRAPESERGSVGRGPASLAARSAFRARGTESALRALCPLPGPARAVRTR